MSSIKHIDRCSKLFNSWDSLLNKSNTPSKSISEWKRDTKFLLSLISVILRSPSDNIAMHLSSWILYLSSTSFQSLKQNKITKLKKTNKQASIQALNLCFDINWGNLFVPLCYITELNKLFLKYCIDNPYAILKPCHLKLKEKNNFSTSWRKQI